ncbi:putative Pfs domain protein [Aspergillus clavatus NRRL 1]|uniref:Nucleoside phosphorylase domain-containing protein n=1 Tax=Aspergillus clavatus (strain ATCC 1007 / CBS 513.65 / DSM 816 / NCTC 3887 / NRRL 1 / QM 1276 / 107) TaxID=344612 RepID=A1C8S3_ASPCL|nr:uncharacterized protein ACLA_044300 [Aspergillus clavatus NRRL 1]EAW13710.1 conserved hypothetical protein [Aspergillus clavatus NRRL 1]
MEYPRPTRRDQFKVAILCALAVESDAVEAIFDEYYDEEEDDFGQHTRDQNTYLNGRVGQHYVVLVYVGGMGKVKAMAATSNLKLSYRNIQLALVVGVCGGIPRSNDGKEIYLGDVLVSDRLVQWDIGKHLPHGFLRKVDPAYSQTRPNQETQALLDRIRDIDKQHQRKVALVQHLAAVQKVLGDRSATYPGIDQDCLFPSTHLHQHRGLRPCGVCVSCGDCEDDGICKKALNASCDELGCIDKAPSCRIRSASPDAVSKVPSPAVHVGPIASGDTVLVSGEDRDRLVAREGVIGVEMEGIGLWKETPCIVIKAVADYADCHKAKAWQRYAAGTAASFTKLFLLDYLVDTPDTPAVPLTGKTAYYAHLLRHIDSDIHLK